ncbi:unnamed protein product [Brassica rapa]|uniref:Glycosyltransferase 2-like domain-containing protein n=1 Tax=Brassica campestris TaxID=3711 RepID=A0A8D9HUE2_BRACM|nr:unnamed protein product [Brassica rapa]
MVLLPKPLIFLHDLSLALFTFHEEGLKASVDGVGLSMYTMWNSMRSTLIVPVFRCLVALCLIISVLVSIESVYMNLVILYVKLFGRKPEKVYKWEEMQKDMELGHQNYPVILIQIPMYNEREVFELSIGAACRLMWPSDRLIVQVLDDSTDPDIMELISTECAKWAKDINIKYERRDNRNGYKAGALKHGMRHSYVKQCNYVVIFDADFQPETDYLQRTIPFLIHNPELALVQARWKFGDSLSPYLFVLAMECLSRLLLSRYDAGYIGYHPRTEELKILHLMFADDVMVFFDGTANSLHGISECLDDFASWSGLHINTTKTELFTVGSDQSESVAITRYGLTPGKFPIRYLGLPLTSRKLKISEYAPLMSKITTRLQSLSAKLLSFSGRLQLLKTVIFGIVTFWISAFILPKGLNANTCLLTRMQEMSLNYHFMAEQQSGSTRHAFFGFNGTAGVWRIAAMEEAGGWKDRTTVEDMDLAVRVGLLGWKFVFINDVEVKSELPSQFKAFRFQQHRWSCGPANLFRKMTMEIIHNQRVKIWKKFYVIYSFFFLRKIMIHSFTFFFYCVILPISVFVPEVKIPNWATIYVPSVITLLSAIATPRSFYLLIFWVLFENVMAMHRAKGTLIGLFEGGRVNEWVVTEKLGDSVTTELLPQSRKPRYGFLERVNSKEMVMGIYILCCACYDFFFGNAFLYLYLLMQAAAFLISGVGFVGS